MSGTSVLEDGSSGAELAGMSLPETGVSAGEAPGVPLSSVSVLQAQSAQSTAKIRIMEITFFITIHAAFQRICTGVKPT